MKSALWFIAGFIIGVLMMVEPAPAHDWYELDCCRGEDCNPVDLADVAETKDGWVYLPTGNEFKGAQIRPSQDRHFHVCIGVRDFNKGKSLCIYILQGS